MNAFEKFFDTPQFDYDGERKKLLANMDMLKSMTAEEHTFYKKYKEIFDYRDFISKSGEVKAKIWTPRDITNENLTVEDIENLKPEVVFVKDSDEILMKEWLILRVFVHTMPFDQNPGRFLRFLVRDSNTKKYMGFLSIASDVITITDRDKYIGWSSKDRLENHLLSNSSIASCIAPTQPFGYNFIGGKLVASLVTSKVVRDVWEEIYDAKLVGMTTTNLYGSYSMYNGIPYWHKCGSSAGKMFIKPDDDIYDTWHHWIQENKKEEYTKKMEQKEGVSGPVTGAKLKVIQMIFNELKIKSSDYAHGYERGVYYSCFYENTKEFLQGKIKEKDLVLKDKFKDDIDGMILWWKSKAIARYKKLKDEGNLKPDILYYNKMLGKEYKSVKHEFFHEVGR
jgi:hypothetical protein